jgi:hypothetical protein
MDNGMLNQLLAEQQHQALERRIRETYVLDQALAEQTPSGLRTRLAGTLTRIAMHIDAAASARAVSAQR